MHKINGNTSEIKDYSRMQETIILWDMGIKLQKGDTFSPYSLCILHYF